MFFVKSEENITFPLFSHLQVSAQDLQNVIVKVLYISALEKKGRARGILD